MPTIYFATTNAGKVESVTRHLAPFGISVAHESIDLEEPRSDSLVTIAHAKVQQAYEQIKKPCIVIDAGFYIKALNDWPGTYVNHELKHLGLEGILTLIAGKPRDCLFLHCLAYKDNDAGTSYFIGKASGMLASYPKGDQNKKHWSKLFQIFIPYNHTKTLAEMNQEEYEQWSERQGKTFYQDIACIITHRAQNFVSPQLPEDVDALE